MIALSNFKESLQSRLMSENIDGHPYACGGAVGTSMWHRCCCGTGSSNIDVAPLFADDHRCHIDVGAGGAVATSMSQRCRCRPEPGDGAGRARVLGLALGESGGQRLPRRACSRSMASNRALKLPLPNPCEPCRSISSKNTVGRSCTGLVKICSR